MAVGTHAPRVPSLSHVTTNQWLEGAAGLASLFSSFFRLSIDFSYCAKERTAKQPKAHKKKKNLECGLKVVSNDTGS